MASAGIRETPTGRFKVWWRLDDGSQGAKTVATRTLARDFMVTLLADVARDTWVDPRRGRLPFSEWADHWWQLWSSMPHRSPHGLETTESHLRCHLRPYFGSRPLGKITPSVVQRWQNELEGKLSYSGVMACRSVLLRIMEAARKDRLVAGNPVREVDPPRRPVDPDVILGNVKRRTFTTEELGRFLAACQPHYRDHFLTQVGTGLRSGELLGLRRRRVHLERRRIEVVDVRYDAGRFGSGYKDRPKSTTSIRVVPMADVVHAAITRQLPSPASPDDLVFTGPGGGPGRWLPGGMRRGPGHKRGSRTPLSTSNLRRAFKRSLIEQAKDSDGTITEHPRFPDLDLRGPHDLRHTFATWLEDDGIPSRVIDELMGHSSGRREHARGGSAIGASYRHTTAEMEARVVAAVDARLGAALKIAADLLPPRASGPG